MLTSEAAKRIGKITAMVLAGVLGFGLLLVLVTVMVLNSQRSQAWLMSQLEEPLAEAGIRWSYQDFSIHLFSHIHFDQLQLDLAEPLPVQGQIQLQTLRLGYGLGGILQKHLDIIEFVVSGLKGEILLRLPEAQEEIKEDKAPSSFDLQQFFTDPPASLKLAKLELSDIDFTLHLEAPHMAGTIVLDDVLVEAAFDLAQGRTAGQWSAKLPATFDIKLQDNEQKLHSSGNLQLSHRGQLQAQGDESQWSQQVDLPETKMLLQNFKLRQEQAKASTELALREFRFTTSLAMQKPETVYRDDYHNFLPLLAAIEGGLALDGLDIQQKSESGPQDIKLGKISGSWNFTPEISSSRKPIAVAGDGKLQVAIGPLQIQQGKQSLLSMPELTLALHSASDGSQPNGNLLLKLKDLRLPDIKQALNLEQNLQWKVALSPLRLDLSGDTQLNQIPVLALKLAAYDLEQNSKLDLTTELTVAERLKNLHQGAAILGQLGDLRVNLEQNLQLKHDKAVWEEDWSDWRQIRLDHQLNVNLQQNPPRTKPLLRLAGMDLKLASKLEQGDLTSKLKLQAKALRHELLQKAVDLEQVLQLDARLLEPLAADIDAQTRLNGEQLLKLRAKLKDQPQNLHADYQLVANIGPKQSGLMEAMQILNQLGDIAVNLQQDIAVQHDASSITHLDFASYHKDIESKLRLKLQIDDKTARNKLLVQVDKALELSNDASIDGMRAHAQTSIKLPRIRLPETLEIDGTTVESSVHVDHIERLDTITASMDLAVRKATVLMDIPDRAAINDLLRDVKGQVKATVANQSEVQLETVSFSLADPLVKFSGVGEGAAAGSGNFQGALKIQLPGQLGEHTQLQGGIEVPISVALFDQRSISLMLTPQFRDVALRYPSFNVQGLDGNFVVREELRLLESGSIDFLYYENHNPFARVDYDTVEPLVVDRKLLSIDSLQAEHIGLGPLVTSIEIRQNMILLNDLRLNLLGGSALGRMYLNLNPANPQVGFLGRFTQLDPRLLLPPEQRAGMRESGVISGRSALVFDIRKRLATGRLDITSIGRQQLLRFIDLIDPNFEDPQLGAARKALYVAYPQKVSIDMDQGMMDLEIQLGGALSQTLNIRSLPLTPLIVANADEPLSQIEKILSATGDEP
ncbi:MAG: hypothetical protein ACOH5I_10280 [Oligoflexus sp.]